MSPPTLDLSLGLAPDGAPTKQVPAFAPPSGRAQVDGVPRREPGGAPEVLADLPDDPGRFTRWSVDAEGLRTGESSLRLAGLYCAACAGPIERALGAVDGVLGASVNPTALRATVRWDPRRTGPAALVAAVRSAGYEAQPDTPAGAQALRRQESRQALWRLFVAAFCTMQVMMLATPAYVAGPGGIEPDLQRLLNWGSWVMSLPVMLFSASPFFRGAWAAVRARRIGMDVPVAIGIAVSFVASSGAAFDPGGLFGREVYFDSLTMFVAFLLAGRALELRARHRAAESLENALGALPETALRLRGGAADPGAEADVVRIDALRPGDLVRVPVGQGFPADGRLVAGSTSADESLLTGESRPRVKAPGEAVLAGSLNLGAPVVVSVERVGPDTRHDAIVALMREAQSQRPASARWADRWAAPFLWTVLLLAAAAAAVWSFIDPARAVWVAVSVLIVTCPCALSLATPSALLVASDTLARRGVLLRRLEALETLAGCSRLFVDKTGTLTEDRLRLVGVDRLPQAGGTLTATTDSAPLLQSAATLAGWSRHPLSRALAEAAQARGNAQSVAWREVRESPGAGLEALDAEGRRWRLGRFDWVRAEGVHALPGLDLAPAAPSGDGRDDAGLAAWFGPAGQPLLRLRFEESLREGSSVALQALRAEGLPARLLSGDAPARVERVAQALGIEAAPGAATPDGKLAAVRAAQAAGETVVMLGDGINDAPVLAQADVSIAMGSGALLARSQADAVLLGDRLSGVLEMRRMARRCMAVIRQNLAWAAAYNALCVPLALAGALPPWAAGLGMAASSLAVVGNALRLAR